MKCLAVPTGTVDEIHELLKSGGMVVRPQVVDVQQLADMVPLTKTAYVDRATSAPVSLQDNSIAYPFSTIQAACDALGSPGGVKQNTPKTNTEPANSNTTRQNTLVALG